MRKYLSILGFLSGVMLLLASPAFATSYSSAVLLDWSSLTFSGVGSDLSPGLQGNSHFLNECCSGALADPWSDFSRTVILPGVAATTTYVDNRSLFASLNVFSPDLYHATIAMARIGQINVLETGFLTMSIPYTIMQAGASSLGSGFFSTAQAGLGFCSLGGPACPLTAEILSTSGDGAKTGTLSITRFFQAGDQVPFSAIADIRYNAVPVPDMLWPTLAGLVAIAVYAERIRRRSTTSSASGLVGLPFDSRSRLYFIFFFDDGVGLLS
jgi:hypothetical protein